MAAAVTADRLTASYLVPRDHPRPEDVRARMDDVARRLLPAALAAALGPRGRHDEQGVCLIRRLQVDLSVGMDTDEAQVAGAWAERIAREIDAVLAGDDGEDLRRFPTPAAYLSQFLADLAAGRAWQTWWYRPFAGLQALPASTALRTAISQEPSAGAEALLGLAPSRLAAVVRAMSAADAGRALQALALAGADSAAEGPWEALLAAWMRAAPPEDEPDQAQALLLYMETLREGAAPGPRLAAGCRALPRLVREARARPQAQTQALWRALRAGAAADIYRLLGPEAAEAVAPLLETPAPWRDELAAALHRPGADAGAADRVPEVSSTPFGGAFLMLPALDALPWSEATAGWPALDETLALVVVRFLALLGACGGARGARAFDDPLLREVMGVPAGMRAAALRPWADALGPSQHDHFANALGPAPETRPADVAFVSLPASLGLTSIEPLLRLASQRLLRDFARRLPGFGAASFAHLHANFLDVPGAWARGEERDTARLERPPLHIVLSMTRLVGGEARLSFRPRPLAVLLEGPA